MDLSKLQDDRIISDWLAVESEAGERVELPVDAVDWSRIDEIRADIYLPPGADGQIRCNLTLDSHTEGFDGNDGYYFNAIVSPRGGNLWEGWREIRLPAECFYVRGIPAGWDRMQSAVITPPGGGRIRNVRLLERDVVRGPRMTDRALIEALDLDRPGLEKAKQAGSTGETLREIASYFRSSPFDRKLQNIRMPAKPNQEEADRVLAGRIMGQDWSEGIDWNANPTGYIEWSIPIHHFPYLRPVMSAWWETQKPEYAAFVERVITDWLQRHPVPYGVRACGNPWGHSLVVANRPFQSLVEAFCVLCAAPNTQDQSIVDTLKSFYEHEAYLLKFQSFPPSNKTIAEARTSAAIGCAFPEFRESAYWREEGYRRLLDDMQVQVMSDGASYELTPGYQMAIASWFLESYGVAQKFNHSLDPELEAGIRKMYDWSVSITRPDFTRPSVSDAGSLNTKYGESLTKPGRVLQNETALWVGTEGKEGCAPDYNSIAHKDSGYFIMRSGWDPDTRYLLFEGGPYGRFHQHEDMLNIDLYAFGAPFIVDPGITSYFPNAWTTFYRTTAAHNTVLVDGRGQARGTIQAVDEWVESARDKTVWRSDSASDVAMATYSAGFADLDPGITHRRAVMFIKPDYFVLFDELSGEGKHTYEALFHFMPYRVLIDPDTKAVRTGRMGAPNIEILPLTRISPRLVCGGTDPVQGWLAIGGQDVPAPVAIFKKQTTLPFRTGYVITPFRADRVTAGVTTKCSRRGDRWNIRIARPDGREDWVEMDWASDNGPVLR